MRDSAIEATDRTSNDLLATIVTATRRVVAVREEQESLSSVSARACAVALDPGRLRAALTVRERVNVIAECKRRSPSRGVLRRDYDPAAIAQEYVAAGAIAISVLTEPAFFDGSLEHLTAVRRFVDVPVLRKDFIVSEYQLFEARAAGADAVLLIVAALPETELQRLLERARDLALDALVEVHSATELAAAIDAGAEIVGVNNRNLRTLSVDLSVSEELIQRMPAGVIAVSESGLRTMADLSRLRSLGYFGFLIGERLMAAPNPGLALRDLMADSGVGDPDGFALPARREPSGRGEQP